MSLYLEMHEDDWVEKSWDGVKYSHVEAISDEKQDITSVCHQPLNGGCVIHVVVGVTLTLSYHGLSSAWWSLWLVLKCWEKYVKIKLCFRTKCFCCRICQFWYKFRICCLKYCLYSERSSHVQRNSATLISVGQFGWTWL